MVIGVVGTGTMGPSIAIAFALCDKVKTVKLCKGRESARTDGSEAAYLILDKAIHKEKITCNDAGKCKEKLMFSNIDGLFDADLVVEAISEDIEAKKGLFKALEKICSSACIFASNTSSLSIKKLSDNITHDVIGMHFFNPVIDMRLIEIVQCDDTPIEITEVVYNIAKEMGKKPVIVKNSPGFVVNRLLIPMINEAINLYAEGIATAEDIDTSMKFGANHPIGPLALGDLIGLDVVLTIMKVLYEETGNTKYLPAQLLTDMVGHGKLGRKTGSGFYDY